MTQAAPVPRNRSPDTVLRFEYAKAAEEYVG